MSHPMDHLWKDLFADAGYSKAMVSVRQGLKARRRRMVAKCLGGLGTLVACAGVLWLALPLLSFLRKPPSFQDELSKLNIPPVHQAEGSSNLAQAGPTGESGSTGAAPNLPGVRFISDSELLERFRGQPVALVGPPENRRLIITSTPTFSPEESYPQPDGVDLEPVEDER